MHNKIIVVDNEIAILGGRNISNQYFDQSEKANYIDRDVLITGSLIQDLTSSFEAYWDFKRSVSLEQLKDVIRRTNESDFEKWSNPNTEFQKAIDGLLKDPSIIQDQIDRKLRPVKHAWLSMDPPGKNRPAIPNGLWATSTTSDDIMNALKKAEIAISIESPYLVMDRGATKFLRRLKKEKPDIELVAVTDSYASTGNMPAYAATFRSRPRALALGFKIFELKPHPRDKDILIKPGRLGSSSENPPGSSTPYASIHAKSMVIDNRVSYVG